MTCHFLLRRFKKNTVSYFCYLLVRLCDLWLNKLDRRSPNDAVCQVWLTFFSSLREMKKLKQTKGDSGSWANKLYLTLNKHSLSFHHKVHSIEKFTCHKHSCTLIIKFITNKYNQVQYWWEASFHRRQIKS